MPTNNDELVRNLGQADIDRGANALREDVERHNRENPTSDLELGKQIAAILSGDGYHPVIVIGGPAAGKSTLAASLLARPYARNEPSSVDLRFDEKPIFPGSHPLHKEIWIQTKEFCEGVVQNFAAGQLVARTRSPHPFYLPVEVIPKNPKLDAVKLAFLECRGEVFGPVRRKVHADGGEYLMSKDLPEVIAGVLINFTKAVSFVYVAPGKVDDDVDPLQRRMADLALFHAIDNCYATRAQNDMASSDRHLFLLSMWDEHTGGIGAEAFRSPDMAAVERALATGFPQSWQKYCNLRAESRETQHYVMQYSAGPVVRGQVVPVAMESWPLLNRYPRTVLNWLYRNAGGGKKALYPDVMKSSRSPMTLMVERAMAWIGGGR